MLCDTDCKTEESLMLDIIFWTNRKPLSPNPYVNHLFMRQNVKLKGLQEVAERAAGIMQLVLCSWYYAAGIMQLVLCSWYYANWYYAAGIMHYGSPQNGT